MEFSLNFCLVLGLFDTSSFYIFPYTFAELHGPLAVSKSDFVEESRILFYKMAQSVVLKKEFKECTMVIVHGNLANNRGAPEVGLIMQQAAFLQTVITINYKETFTTTHQQKFQSGCYTVLAEFEVYKRETFIQKKLKMIFDAFLPNAKFIFRFNVDDARIKQKVLFGPYLSRFSWNILQVAVDYNKLNQMRTLLYYFCHNCPVPGRNPRSTRVGVPVLSAGMGHDGIIKEYRSSLFPDYDKNFQDSYFHLIYHPSTLGSLGEKDHSLAAETDLSFNMMSLIAKNVNLTVKKEKIKYEYEFGIQYVDEDRWNGYLGRLLALDYAIGLAFIPQSKYIDFVDVSHPYSTFSIGMLYADVSHSEHKSVWASMSLIYSFEFIVHITIFAIFVGTILYAIERSEKKYFPGLNRTQLKITSQRGKWKNYAWLSVKTWFHQPFSLPPSTHLKTSGLFLCTWWITCILFTALIKTFLISIMSQPVKSILVMSLSDLMEKENWAWGTFLKPAVWKDMVGNSTFDKLSNEMQYFDSYASCIEKVSESKFACIGTAGILKTFYTVLKNEKSGSHLVYIDTELMPMFLTFAFRKNSPYSKTISKKLQYVIEAEMNHRHMEDALNKNFLLRRNRHLSEITNNGDEISNTNSENLLYTLELGGEDFDISFTEQLTDSFEEVFELETEDIFTSVFIGLTIAIITFVIEQMVYSLRNFKRNKQRERGHRRTAAILQNLNT